METNNLAVMQQFLRIIEHGWQKWYNCNYLAPTPPSSSILFQF